MLLHLQTLYILRYPESKDQILTTGWSVNVSYQHNSKTVKGKQIYNSEFIYYGDATWERKKNVYQIYSLRTEAYKIIPIHFMAMDLKKGRDTTQ